MSTCCYYLRGKCKFGDSCHNLHVSSGACQFYPHCDYGHGEISGYKIPWRPSADKPFVVNNDSDEGSSSDARSRNSYPVDSSDAEDRDELSEDEERYEDDEIVYCFICAAPAQGITSDIVRAKARRPPVEGWDWPQKKFNWLFKCRLIHPEITSGVSEVIEYNPENPGKNLRVKETRREEKKRKKMDLRSKAKRCVVRVKKHGELQIYSGHDSDIPEEEFGFLVHDLCLKMLRMYLPETRLSNHQLHELFCRIPAHVCESHPNLRYGAISEHFRVYNAQWPVLNHEAYFVAEPSLSYCPRSLQQSEDKALREVPRTKTAVARREDKKGKTWKAAKALLFGAPYPPRSLPPDGFEFLKEEDLLSSLPKVRLSIGSFALLPKEIFMALLNMLAPQDIVRFQSVSSGLRKLIRRQSYWKERYESLLQSLPLVAPYRLKFDARQPGLDSQEKREYFNRVYKEAMPVVDEDYFAAFWELYCPWLRNTVRIHLLVEEIWRFQATSRLPEQPIVELNLTPLMSFEAKPSNIRLAPRRVHPSHSEEESDSYGSYGSASEEEDDYCPTPPAEHRTAPTPMPLPEMPKPFHFNAPSVPSSSSSESQVTSVFTFGQTPTSTSSSTPFQFASPSSAATSSVRPLTFTQPDSSQPSQVPFAFVQSPFTFAQPTSSSTTTSIQSFSSASPSPQLFTFGKSSSALTAAHAPPFPSSSSAQVFTFGQSATSSSSSSSSAPPSTTGGTFIFGARPEASASVYTVETFRFGVANSSTSSETPPFVFGPLSTASSSSSSSSPSVSGSSSVSFSSSTTPACVSSHRTLLPEPARDNLVLTFERKEA